MLLSQIGSFAPFYVWKHLGNILYEKENNFLVTFFIFKLTFSYNEDKRNYKLLLQSIYRWQKTLDAIFFFLMNG